MRSTLAVLLGLGFFFTNAAARVYNYADIPVGERAAGMGMTAVAASSDVGDAYVNPAAVADLQAPMIGASVSSYSKVDARTGEFVSLFDSVKDAFVRGGAESIPAFVGGNFNTNGWVWGGGVILPSSLTFNGTMRPHRDDVVTYSAQSRTTHLLTFVSKRQGTWSFGASLALTSLSEEERFFELASVNPNVIKNAEYYYSLNAMLLGLGTVWDFAPGWRVGFSSSLPMPWVGGEGSFAEVESGGADSTIQSFRIRKHPFPVRLSWGLEWMPAATWTVAGDVHWYSGFERDIASGLPGTLLDLSAKPIVNFNLGVQWRAWPRVGLRGGVFSNLSSSNRQFSRYGTLQDAVNFLGASFAVYFPTPNGSISLGGFFQGGQGRMPDVAAETGSVRRSIYLYGAVLGSTYLFL